MAALVLLERLSPAERAVFVLREVFGFGYRDIASAVGRSEAACRQLAMRARRFMDAGRPRFQADRAARDRLARRFFDALASGDLGELQNLLAADVRLVGDGGGQAPQWADTFAGAEKVARVLAVLMSPFVRIGGTALPHQVNGQPGAILRDRDGGAVATLTLDICDGRVQTIRAVSNPDKFGHVGPAGDVWAVFGEMAIPSGPDRSGGRTRPAAPGRARRL